MKTRKSTRTENYGSTPVEWFMSISTYAVSMPFSALASPRSSTARTSIGGLSPSFCARIQRFVRSIPIEG
jgi:hypothetical protein